MTIKVTFMNNVSKQSFMVDSSTKIQEFLNENELNYGFGTVHLNGETLLADDLEKTFDDFEITEECFMAKLKNADNA